MGFFARAPLGEAIFKFNRLRIGSPKRNKRLLEGWDGFFPYYAGFPEQFASDLLVSSGLRPDAIVLDPWNGSGTTTYAAARLGFRAVGLDINPVMVVVARARMLPPSEADALLAAANRIQADLSPSDVLDDADPLSEWFGPGTASTIRTIERGIRKATVSHLTVTEQGVDLGRISGLAATLYIALFDVCRQLTSKHQSSNPTWLRDPAKHGNRIGVPSAKIADRFKSNVERMVTALADVQPSLLSANAAWRIEMADSTGPIEQSSIDCVLTSPPYCTRIDYTAATRVELAVLGPLIEGDRGELSRRMIGSIRVPQHKIDPTPSWGHTCLDFLQRVRSHDSKASATYYYRTHLDYFDKMSRSMRSVSSALRDGGLAFFVVQDSYYKDVHNDLPQIIIEMAETSGLRFGRRADFSSKRSMASINPHTKRYGRASAATEAVLCFQKVY